MALSACGLLGDEDEGNDSRTREEFCRAWASAACNEEVVSVCQAADAEACRQSQEDFCRTLVPDDFSDEHGAACIDAVESAYADGDLSGAELLTVRRLGEPCDRLGIGPKEQGESCEERADCDASGGFDCVIKSDAAQGVCEIPEIVAPGEDCDAAQQVCTAGFFCNGENCIAGMDIGDACERNEECGDEGYCDANGECAERFAVSEPCTDDAQCATGICYELEAEQVCTNRVVLSRSEPVCEDLS